MRHRGRSRAAERTRLHAGGEIFSEAVCLDRHRGAEHLDFDTLTLAGALTREQTLQHRLRDDGRGGEIDMREMAEHLAAPVLGSCYTAPSAERLYGRVDARLLRHRTDASVCAGDDVHDFRIHPGNDVVAKPEALDRAGPHVINEDVAFFDDFERGRTIGLVLEVQLD